MGNAVKKFDYRITELSAKKQNEIYNGLSDAERAKVEDFPLLINVDGMNIQIPAEFKPKAMPKVVGGTDNNTASDSDAKSKESPEDEKKKKSSWREVMAIMSVITTIILLVIGLLYMFGANGAMYRYNDAKEESIQNMNYVQDCMNGNATNSEYYDSTNPFMNNARNYFDQEPLKEMQENCNKYSNRIATGGY